MADTEIFENAMVNVQDQVEKRQETVKLLNEYGIFLIQLGLPPQDYAKIKVVTYDVKLRQIGVLRCSICFKDFNANDRLKQFPSCKHLFHIKCLELWCSFEARCAVCLKYFPGTPSLPAANGPLSAGA
jgi:hypothetical protein